MMRIRKGVSSVFALILFSVLVFTSCKSRKLLSDNPGIEHKDSNGYLRQKYAAVLGVSEQDIKNEKLYRFIDEWMGVRHKMGGMDKTGVDCSGFTVLLQKEIYNRDVPRVSKQIAEAVNRKDENQLQEGDLVFFDFSGQKLSHVGVYLKNNRFVHASLSKGVVISNLKDPWYYKYFSRGGSVKSDALYSEAY